jgi:signal transduction histidine kinase
MRTLLAVPVLCHGAYRGNLYLSEKDDNSPFTGDDEETLVRFAQQAAIAIDNARLHRDTHELAAARERLNIAAETYDSLAQVLAYVNTKTQVVREHCRAERHDEAMRHLDQLAAAAREVFAEHRARLLDLRTLPEGGGGTSTVQAIVQHVRAWEDETELDVDLSLPESIDAPAQVELQLLRIVQEGLDNVRRHARASKVRLSLEQRSDGLHLQIADDGVGFDPGSAAPGNGAPRFGLAAMRERATAVGGALHLEAAPGAGTLLSLDLPTAREGPHATPAG